MGAGLAAGRGAKLGAGVGARSIDGAVRMGEGAARIGDGASGEPPERNAGPPRCGLSVARGKAEASRDGIKVDGVSRTPSCGWLRCGSPSPRRWRGVP